MFKHAAHAVTKRALTGIEVVVVTVCAVALTLPAVSALGGVGRNSKQSQCMNHLARIGYANLIYSASDPTGMALPVHGLQNQQCLDTGPRCEPRFHIGAYEWGGKSGIGQTEDTFDGADPKDPLNSRYGTMAGFGPSSRPLNRILYTQDLADHLHPEFDRIGALEDTQLDLESNRCPSDIGYTGIHCAHFADSGLTSYDHYGTSYNANVFMIASAGGGAIRSNSPYLRPLAGVPSPATTIAYMENNGRYAWEAAPEPCDGTINGLLLEGVPGTVRGWHGKDWTFNAAFLDGHVRSVFMRGYDLSNPGLPERQYPGLACTIIRGPDWQVDTLPADLIETGHRFGGGGGRTSFEGCDIK